MNVWKQIARRSILCSHLEHPQAAAVKEKYLALHKVAVQLANAKVLPRMEELDRVAADASAKTNIERIEARWHMLQKRVTS